MIANTLFADRSVQDQQIVTLKNSEMPYRELCEQRNDPDKLGNLIDNP